ncbi:MAG: phytanoyl-CoA dioxygenase family protein [Gemmataceae bacterium]
MGNGPLSANQMTDFERRGFVLLRGLFDREECELLLDGLSIETGNHENALARRDGEGGVTRLKVWNQAGDDLFGLVGRLPRMVDPVEQVLAGEVYLYHSKVTMKEPFTGGAWAWHQDYGYWYNNGCLFPLMASCMVALDPCTRENGCLQVLEGSHLMGRIDHGKVGDQTGADPDRVAEAVKVLPTVYCEMAPGDALLFHCNTLHRSDQNHSPTRRTTFICCYNAARNNPYKEHHHPRYYPLEKVADSALKEYRANLVAKG